VAKTIYEMKLHDELAESPWYITRVPGGWLYLHNDHGTSPTFVPFSLNGDLPHAKEENSDSPATPVQQLKEAISLLNRWMDDPDESHIVSDTYNFVSNGESLRAGTKFVLLIGAGSRVCFKCVNPQILNNTESANSAIAKNNTDSQKCSGCTILPFRDQVLSYPVECSNCSRNYKDLWKK